MERMKKEKESGTLLGVGTAYLPVKEIKGEFYVKVSDFTRCMDGIRIEQEADRKHIEQLEEENEKLKKYYDRDKEELMESCYSLAKENDELKKENKKLKSDLAFERTMLDNVRAEYKSLQNVNKKLKEERDKYYAEWHLRHS